mmetsp:Transcript_60781/g.112776  ORF Transcript_60781/g.112776 Transcript_60781/m.112776 type:complete len:161 (-) Transcript_60781:302-784(-)
MLPGSVWRTGRQNLASRLPVLPLRHRTGSVAASLAGCPDRAWSSCQAPMFKGKPLWLREVLGEDLSTTVPGQLLQTLPETVENFELPLRMRRSLVNVLSAAGRGHMVPCLCTNVLLFGLRRDQSHLRLLMLQRQLLSRLGKAATAMRVLAMASLLPDDLR